MKAILVAMAVFCFYSSFTLAQFDLFDKAKEKIEDVLTKKDDKPKKEETTEADDDSKSNDEAVNEESETKDTPPVKSSLKSYSKFDFVPGDNLLFYDDFSLDAIGDFPLKWNTNGSGEVVTLNNLEGQWFKLKNGVTYLPYFKIPTFGENFTVEFDILVDVEGKTNYGALYFDLWEDETSGEVPSSSSGAGKPGAYFSMSFEQSGSTNYSIHNIVKEDGGNIQNQIEDKTFKIKEINRISVAVNKQRFRLYVNEKKVLDLPRLLSSGTAINNFAVRTWYWNEDKDYNILLKNIKFAEGKPDTKNRLITEGKLVTRGILFDSGSDKIKPESYGTLKEIAAVLKESQGIKVKVIGHTDSDGDDNSNIDLSRRRAEAVKNTLASEFSVDVSGVEADGKGETEPLGPNDSPEGKANNRRVEFVKL